MISVIESLRSRGLLSAITDPALEARCKTERFSVYTGFDPTATSLHLGSMIPIIGLMHFQRAGHRPIAVVGGGTGMIGDPSGRSTERNLLTTETIDTNVKCIRKQLERFLSFEGENAAIVVNNADWLSRLGFIDMMRDVGKHFRLSDMLAKDSVRTRLESESGISFTEFCYQILQAYDFKHLFETENCAIQAGGQDQWGNITAGCELIRRTLGKESYGVTYQLLLGSNGEKWGKTSGGTKVWLDPEQTSPYEFYQFFVRSEDSDVDRFLRFFTFLDLDEVARILEEHNAAPEKRTGQRRLAYEVTKVVHGEAEAEKARKASEALFGGNTGGAMTDAELAAVFPDVPSLTKPLTSLEPGLDVLDLLVECGLAASKGKARDLRGQGGLYLNNEPVAAEKKAFTSADFWSGTHTLVLRAGKKNFRLIRFE